ncbi:hypothetical protein PFISCL1PPCAC_20190, partial [Pristionchus fissidentatus]
SDTEYSILCYENDREDWQSTARITGSATLADGKHIIFYLFYDWKERILNSFDTSISNLDGLCFVFERRKKGTPTRFVLNLNSPDDRPHSSGSIQRGGRLDSDQVHSSLKYSKR